MNKILKMVIKGTIVGSTMVAVNEVIGYHANPYKSATAVRLACNVGSASIGYYIGRKVSDFAVEALENAITAYNSEDK